MASCEKQNPTVYNPEDHIISFSSSKISGCVSDSSWNAADKLGFFLIDNTTQEPLESNIPYTVDQAGQSVTFSPVSSSSALSYPETGSVDLTAYYPYQSSMQGSIYAIDVQDQSNLSAIDLRVATKLEDKTDNSTSQDLTFQHRLSRLYLKIQAGTGIDLEGVSVKMTNLYNSATYDVNVNDKTFDFTAVEATDLILNHKSESSDEITILALIIPQQNNRNTIILTHKDGTEVTFTPSGDFSASMQRNYTLTLHSQAVDLNSYMLTTWGDDTAEEEIPIPNVLIPGLDWDYKQELIDCGCDLNNDGDISYYEAESLLRLSVSTNALEELDQLHYLTNLQSLTVSGANIVSFDVTSNTELLELNCYGASITGVNIPYNTKLVSLDIMSPLVQSVNTVNNTQLKSLILNYTGITSLDLSQNKELAVLGIYGDKIESLDLSNNPLINTLAIEGSTMTQIDLSIQTALEYFTVKETAFQTLDISMAPNLSQFKSSFNPDLAEVFYDSQTQTISSWSYDNTVTTLVDINN